MKCRCYERASHLAPIAQLDRALPSEGRGRGFEFLWVHHDFNFYSITYGIVESKQIRWRTQYVHRTGFLDPNQHCLKRKTAGRAGTLLSGNIYSVAAIRCIYDIIDSCASAKSVGGAK
jgi:hypothetical protein